jgi:hypothetical protein
MHHRFTSWPTIIALIVGGFGLSVLLCAWPVTVQATWTCDWSAIAVSALLFVMSYLLARRHKWARQILLAVVVLGIVRIIVFDGFGAVGPITVYHVPPIE